MDDVRAWLRKQWSGCIKVPSDTKDVPQEVDFNLGLIDRGDILRGSGELSST